LQGRKVTVNKNQRNVEILGKIILLALGRIGASWLQSICSKYGIE